MVYDMNRDRAIKAAKVEALREAAEALSEEDGGQDNTWWYADWLSRRAEDLEATP